MKRRWLKVLTVVAIAAGMAACSDRPGSVTAPAAQPRLAYVNGYTVLRDKKGNEWIVLTGVGQASETKTATIDQDGGQVKLAGTVLTVPRGAVDGPTLFTVTMLTQPYIKAQLSAVTVSANGRRGSKGWIAGEELHSFDRPITLTLSYTGAKENLPDAAMLKGLYVVDDVVQQVFSATVDRRGRSITFTTDHFSDYTPGVPADPDSPTRLW